MILYGPYGFYGVHPYFMQLSSLYDQSLYHWICRNTTQSYIKEYLYTATALLPENRTSLLKILSLLLCSSSIPIILLSHSNIPIFLQLTWNDITRQKCSMGMHTILNKWVQLRRMMALTHGIITLTHEHLITWRSIFFSEVFWKYSLFLTILLSSN